LRRLRFDEGLLERMRFALGREAIQGCDAALPTEPTGVTHDRAGLPPMSTVQAPHCPNHNRTAAR